MHAVWTCSLVYLPSSLVDRSQLAVGQRQKGGRINGAQSKRKEGSKEGDGAAKGEKSVRASVDTSHFGK